MPIPRRSLLFLFFVLWFNIIFGSYEALKYVRGAAEAATDNPVTIPHSLTAEPFGSLTCEIQIHVDLKSYHKDT